MRITAIVCMGCCITLFAGCGEVKPLSYQPSSLAEKLSTDELKSAVAAELEKYAGTFANPKVVGEEVDAGTLKRGQAIYQERCVQCHGVSGGGDGLAAEFLYPRPRDYRRGIFKFTSTPFGGRPLRSDLLTTLRRGIRGTSMPSFNLLPEQELQAVTTYVVLLSRRGELEELLTLTAENEEEIDPEVVKDELVPLVVERWKEAQAMRITPLTMEPEFTSEQVGRGKQAFLTKGCSKCHGTDGRGQTRENVGNDVWGRQTRAADLTSGMLHGGPEPVDIYHRIFGGINGTPMPSFSNALQSEPETIWDLVAYVKYVASRRRHGESPMPGVIRPYESPTPVQNLPPADAGNVPPDESAPPSENEGPPLEDEDSPSK